MADLYVPYYNGKPDPEFDRDFVARYLLYSIDVNKEAENNIWTNNNFEYNKSDDTSRAIAEKFKGLQKYFEKRYYTRPCRAEFEIRTWHTYPLKNNSCEKRHMYIKALNQQTPSVFLGIFLKAAEMFQRQEFKDEWQVICATGDIDYDEMNGKVKLVSVGDIEDKYKGEFLTEADKDENQGKKYLFLYIGDEEDEKKTPEGENLGKNRNITVKRFPPGDTLNAVKMFIFKPFDYNYDLSYLDWKDEEGPQLIKEMKNATVRESRCKYLPGEKFYEFEESALEHKDWPGFFIHGTGDSGKTTITLALVRHLVWVGKIYAPIWVRIEREEIPEIINKEQGKAHDGIKKHIISKINKLKNVEEIKKKEKDYLIVIDNLELPESVLKYVMETLLKIFPEKESRPYLIITSRNICSDFQGINKELNLKPVNPPQLDKELFPDFIRDIAEKEGYSDKIKAAEKNNTFNDLVEIMFKTRKDIPGSVITSLGPLQYADVNVAGLINDISKYSAETEIYEMVFSFLEKTQKQVLYSFFGDEDDDPISFEDIHNKIVESGHWEEIPTEQQLRKILRVLLNNNLIYAQEQEDKTFRYVINSAPYYTILFEKEFLGSLEESGEYLRDIFIDLEWQLEKALQHDQKAKIVEPLLRKMMAKKGEMDYDLLFNLLFFAVHYTTDLEVFSLLENFGGDFEDVIEDVICMFLRKNITPLKWLLKKFGNEIEPHSRIYYIVYSVLHCADNIDVLECVYEKFGNRIEPIIIDNILNGMPTIFHNAISFGNIDVLNWFLKKLGNKNEMLGIISEGEMTVLHWAAMSYNAYTLEWLFEKLGSKKEMLDIKDAHGRTVLHHAAAIGSIDALNWLFNKIADNNKILECKDEDGGTIFHYGTCGYNDNIFKWQLESCGYIFGQRVKYGNIDYYEENKEDVHIQKVKTLEWLLEKFGNKDKLLESIDDNGKTLFHWAVVYDNVAALDWLFEKFKKKTELLKGKDKHGKTALDYAIEKKIPAVLDWFYRQVPELLSCKEDYS